MDFEENHLKQGVCTSGDYKNKINLSLKYITTIYKCILCKGEFNDPSAVLDHLKVNHLDTIIVPITKQENMDEELLESNSKRNQEIKVKAVMEFHSKSRLSILILISFDSDSECAGLVKKGYRTRANKGCRYC